MQWYSNQILNKQKNTNHTHTEITLTCANLALLKKKCIKTLQCQCAQLWYTEQFSAYAPGMSHSFGVGDTNSVTCVKI